MSSKIGLIISMIFVALFMFLGIDLITVQFSYSDLDSKGVTISYLVSKEGRTDNEFISYLEDKYNVKITNLPAETPLFGDVIDFTLSKKVKVILVANGELDIQINRSAVIGYYG